MPDLAEIIEAFRGAPVALDQERARSYVVTDSDEGDRSRQPQAAEPYAIARNVAILPVRGLLTKRSAFAAWMGWATYDGIEAAMRSLDADEDVSAIVLDIDSPGGMAYGVGAASAAIAAASKPVYAFVDPLCASAAYHLASQAKEIVIAPGSAVGSIGVAMMTMKPVQPNIMGDQWYEFTSSNAENKRPDPDSDAGRAEIVRELDEIEAAFLADVSSGRGVSLSIVKSDFGRGGVFFGEAAVTAGLADRIATRPSFYDEILKARGGKPARQRRSTALHATAAQAVAAL